MKLRSVFRDSCLLTHRSKEMLPSTFTKSIDPSSNPGMLRGQNRRDGTVPGLAQRGRHRPVLHYPLRFGYLALYERKGHRTALRIPRRRAWGTKPAPADRKAPAWAAPAMLRQLSALRTVQVQALTAVLSRYGVGHDDAARAIQPECYPASG